LSYSSGGDEDWLIIGGHMEATGARAAFIVPGH
jgi:hypothetical protein